MPTHRNRGSPKVVIGKSRNDETASESSVSTQRSKFVNTRLNSQSNSKSSAAAKRRLDLEDSDSDSDSSYDPKFSDRSSRKSSRVVHAAKGGEAEKPAAEAVTKQQSSSGVDVKQYCICKHTRDDENWVACDDKQCTHKWFHFTCVGITTKPVGKWYCDSCSANKSSAAAGEKNDSSSICGRGESVTAVIKSIKERVYGVGGMGNQRVDERNGGQRDDSPDIITIEATTNANDGPESSERLRERADTSISDIFHFYQKKIRDLERILDSRDTSLAAKDLEITTRDARNSAKDVEIARKNSELTAMKSEITQLKDALKEMERKQRAAKLLLGEE